MFLWCLFLWCLLLWCLLLWCLLLYLSHVETVIACILRPCHLKELLWYFKLQKSYLKYLLTYWFTLPVYSVLFIRKVHYLDWAFLCFFVYVFIPCSVIIKCSCYVLRSIQVGDDHVMFLFFTVYRHQWRIWVRENRKCQLPGSTAHPAGSGRFMFIMIINLQSITCTLNLENKSMCIIEICEWNDFIT